MADLRKVFLVEQKRGVLILIPRGDAISFLDSDLADEVRGLIEFLDDSDPVSLVFDLESATYFGSVIIGAIVSLSRKAAEKGGRVALCNVSEQMQQVLHVMRLDELWPSFPSLRKALKAVK